MILSFLLPHIEDMLPLNEVLAGIDPGVQVNAGFSEVSWSILIPLVINGALLAYFFGSLSQKIKSLESDLVRNSADVEKMQVSYGRSEANLHRIELLLLKMETRFDMVISSRNESAIHCPVARDILREERQSQLDKDKRVKDTWRGSSDDAQTS